MTTNTRDELKQLLNKAVLLKSGLSSQSKEFEYYRKVTDSIEVILSKSIPIKVQGHNIANGMNSPSETQRIAYERSLENGYSAAKDGY